MQTARENNNFKTYGLVPCFAIGICAPQKNTHTQPGSQRSTEFPAFNNLKTKIFSNFLFSFMFGFVSLSLSFFLSRWCDFYAVWMWTGHRVWLNRCLLLRSHWYCNYRTVNRNNWSTRFIHRKWVNHKFNMCYWKLARTTSVYILES